MTTATLTPPARNTMRAFLAFHLATQVLDNPEGSVLLSYEDYKTLTLYDGKLGESKTASSVTQVMNTYGKRHKLNGGFVSRVISTEETAEYGPLMEFVYTEDKTLLGRGRRNAARWPETTESYWFDPDQYLVDVSNDTDTTGEPA